MIKYPLSKAQPVDCDRSSQPLKILLIKELGNILSLVKNLTLSAWDFSALGLDDIAGP